jgi:hypothetical protein
MSCDSSTCRLDSEVDPQGLARIGDERILLAYPQGRYDASCLPVVRKQEIRLSDLNCTLFTHTRSSGYDGCDTTVLFFIEDSRLERICGRPWAYVNWLQQCLQTATPDLSIYLDMPPVDRFVNVYWSRLVGAYWQRAGLTVIPTISWADAPSFEFCFGGIEQDCVVAVSTLGTRKQGREREFMSGFTEMVRQIEPEAVICYDLPYPGMFSLAQISPVEHTARSAARAARLRPILGQIGIGF